MGRGRKQDTQGAGDRIRKNAAATRMKEPQSRGRSGKRDPREGEREVFHFALPSSSRTLK